MAITVQYQPPMDILSRAGYVAGAGQFAQQQQRLMMAQQEAEANRQLREQQLALSAQDQMFGQQRAMENDQLRRQQLELAAQDNQQQYDLGQQRNQAYLQQLQQNDPSVRANNLWESDTAKSLDKQVNDQKAVLSKLPLTPEGKSVLNKLNGSLREIQARRHTLRPRQYAELVGQWMQEVTNSGIEGYVQPEPTPEDLFTKQVHVDPETGAWVAFDAKGTPRFYDPNKKATATKAQPISAFSPESGEPVPFEQFVKHPDFLTKILPAKKKQLDDIARSKSATPETFAETSTETALEELRKDYEIVVKATAPKQTPKKNGKPLNRSLMVNPASIGVTTPGAMMQQPPTAAAVQGEEPTAHWVFDPNTGQLVRIK